MCGRKANHFFDATPDEIAALCAKIDAENIEARAQNVHGKLSLADATGTAAFRRLLEWEQDESRIRIDWVKK